MARNATHDINLRTLFDQLKRNPTREGFSELLDYVKEHVDIPEEEQEEVGITLDYKESMQHKFFSDEEAKTLFKMLLTRAGVDEHTGNLMPYADICLELFYYLTVYDEKFQDVIETQDYKDMKHLALDKHILEGNEHERVIAAKLVYFISQNIKRLKNWKRFVNPNAVEEMQKQIDSLTETETKKLERYKIPESKLPPQGNYMDVSASEVCDIFGVDPKVGLSEQEINRRRYKYGKNEIPKQKRPSKLYMLFRQTTDFMIIILIITSIVAAATKDFKSSIVLALVVVFNVLVGFIEEVKAEKELVSLLTLNVAKASVLRNGKIEVVDATTLVPGDIVILEEGTSVPADLRLIEESDLFAMEAFLTGESEPVEKDTKIISKKNIPLGDQINMAFMSAVITKGIVPNIKIKISLKGRGKGVVVQIGKSTEIGKISKTLASTRQAKTPLQKKLTSLGFILVILSFILCCCVTGIGILRGYDWLLMVKVGISLAVSVIPEGLVAVTTVTMALGVNRMKKQNAIVRHLAAVETLGSVTVICSDKTGTLTEGKMVLKEISTMENNYKFMGDIKELNQSIQLNDTDLNTSDLQNEILQSLMICALCNNATIQEKASEKIKKRQSKYDFIGDPTEVAMQMTAFEFDFYKPDLVKEYNLSFEHEFAFDSERKRMTVVYSGDLKKIPFWEPTCKFFKDTNLDVITMTKGAVEAVIPVCSHVQFDNKSIKPMTEELRQKLEDKSLEMAKQGMRVLGIAYKFNDRDDDLEDINVVERNLVFLGLAGIMDPPRMQVLDSIQTCKEAGIKVCMITGDHPSTAKFIADTLGILQDSSESLVITGKEFDELLATNRLDDLYPVPQVFARVSPDNKFEIVKFLQKTEVVAMIGDGVNDASSIKKADVGVAMGMTGTDIAKQAADIILADDNFGTIVAAIKEGRRTFDNISKFVMYLLSCNFSEIIIVLSSVAFGLPVPFTSIQILFANLVADVPPSLSLGTEPANRDIMKRPPRHPHSGIFTWAGWGILCFQALVMAGITLTGLAICVYVEHCPLGRARSFSLVLLITIQLVHVFHSKSLIDSIFVTNPFGNHWLIGAFLLSFGLTLAGTYTPKLNKILDLEPLGAFDWGKIAIGVIVHGLLIELGKVIVRIRKNILVNRGYKFFSDI